MNTSTNQEASFVCLLLDELSSFGASEDGGVTRLLYTPAWLEAQLFLANRMKGIGLDVRFDRVGNLFGRLQGKLDDAPVIMTGSHIDTVKSGGKYDGAYGIAAGIAALNQLQATYGQPDISLEVVSFCEEEGSRFPLTYWGSGNVTGMYNWQSGGTIHDQDRVSLQEAMEVIGFGKLDQPDARRTDIAAYVELHIEQGPILERLDKQIGLVEAIVGQRRYVITVQGDTNHAGTTPMSMRCDALVGVAEMMVQLETDARKYGEPLVATVGRIEAWPNTPNVIAGHVQFSLDIRHPNEDMLTEFSDDALIQLNEIAEGRGLKLTTVPWLEAKPSPMSGDLTGRLERIAKELSLSSKRMVSGAGHDAQLFPAQCPTAMLFVPSQGGCSHSPEEYTSPDELEDGVSVLTALLYELGYEEK